MPKRFVEVWTDGSSGGGRGPGGYAAILRLGGHERIIVGGECDTTSQRMELLGAVMALEGLHPWPEVWLYSDSAYLVNCMRQGWIAMWRRKGWRNSRKEPTANRDLWERLDAAAQKHGLVMWQKVKGHTNNMGNNRAHDLAVGAKKEQIEREEVA